MFHWIKHALLFFPLVLIQWKTHHSNVMVVWEMNEWSERMNTSGVRWVRGSFVPLLSLHFNTLHSLSFSFGTRASIRFASFITVRMEWEGRSEWEQRAECKGKKKWMMTWIINLSLGNELIPNTNEINQSIKKIPTTNSWVFFILKDIPGNEVEREKGRQLI